MLYSEIIAVCSQIHTKHINTLCGQNVGFVNFKPGGTYSNHWGLKWLKWLNDSVRYKLDGLLTVECLMLFATLKHLDWDLGNQRMEMFVVCILVLN
jgi:hypothetical protein